LSSRGGWLALWLSLGHAAFALRAAGRHLGPAPSLHGRRARRPGARVARARPRGRPGPARAAPLARPRPPAVVALALGRALRGRRARRAADPRARVGPAGSLDLHRATEAALVALLWACSRGLRARSRRARRAARTPRPVAAARLLVAIVAALLLGEGLARAAHLGERRYSNPMLLVPATSAACRSPRSRSSAPSG
jgi:hypothetical protein